MLAVGRFRSFLARCRSFLARCRSFVARCRSFQVVCCSLQVIPRFSKYQRRGVRSFLFASKCYICKFKTCRELLCRNTFINLKKDLVSKRFFVSFQNFDCNIKVLNGFLNAQLSYFFKYSTLINNCKVKAWKKLRIAPNNVNAWVVSTFHYCL